MAKGNGSTAPNDEGIAIERELPCKLTDDELRMRGDAMAEAELLVDTLKAERRAVNKKIFAATDQRNKLAHVIDSEEENRVVVCKWIADFVQNVYTLVRQDTGDTVEQRAMTAADRQGSLPLPSDPGGLPEGDEHGEVHADELDPDLVDPDRDELDDDGSEVGPNQAAYLDRVKPTKRKPAGKAKVGGKVGGKLKTKQPSSKTKRRVHA